MTYIPPKEGILTKFSISFSRAENATPYAAGTVITAATPAILNIANVVSANGLSGVIEKANISTNQTTCIDQLDLYLFNAAPTVINDGVAFAELAADKAKREGFISFPPLSKKGTASDEVTAWWTEKLPFVCDAGDTDLYIGLVNVNGSTPAFGQVYNISLWIRT